MIRNLKAIVTAVMALVALGAFGVSAVQAAEGHCSVEPCTITVKPDGTPGLSGKTAHQVFVFKQAAFSVSSTCQSVSGSATVATKTFKTVQLSKIEYQKCDVAGNTSTKYTMNGCEYHFVSPAIAPHDATMQIKCPAGKVIEIESTTTGCKITMGSTGVLGGGLKFHDAETGGIKKDLITAEVTVTGIPATVVSAGCPGLSLGAATAEYTTGNVELTGQTAGGVHANLWWE